MRSVIFSTLAAWCTRIFAIALNIVGLPLALDKLGISRFSVFLVVLSIGSWIGFANIGMGRVVANVITRYSNRSASSIQHFASAAVMIAAAFNLILFIVGSCLVLLIVQYVPLTSDIAEHSTEFVTSVLILFFSMCAWFFLSIFEGIDAGYHQLHRLYFFQLGSYAASLILLFFVFPKHPSIALAACLLNVSFLAGSVMHAIDVIKRHRGLFKMRVKLRRNVCRLLAFSSLDFTIISLGIGVLFQLSTGLFGFLFGAGTVVELGLFMRLMQSYGALIIAFTFPLTGVIASQIAHRDLQSAYRTVIVSGSILLAGAGIASCSFYILGSNLLHLWLRSEVNFTGGFITAGSYLIFLSAAHFFLSAVFIAISNTRRLAQMHIVEILLFFPIVFALFQWIGQTGVLIGIDIVLLFGSAWMLWQILNHRFLETIFKTRFLTRRNALYMAE